MLMKRRKKNNSGEILIENIVFLILNLVFLGILILFLIQQSSGIVLLEKPYSKQIALLIDSAKPGMIMKINLNQGKKLADKNDFSFEKIIQIDNEKNFVLVKFSERSGKEYHFFNDLEVGVYYDFLAEEEGIYVLTFNRAVSGEVVR